MRLLTIAVLLLISPAVDSLAANCSRGWICVEARESLEGVELRARNLQPYAVTVTVQARGEGIVPDRENPITLTVPGDASMRVMRLLYSGGRSSRYRYWFDWTVGSLNARHDKDYLYRLPFAPGESYPVLQGFGSSFSHKGLERWAVDFAMPEGSPVHAARDGIVVLTEARHERACWERWCGRYANYVVVLHRDGTTGEYYHLQKDGVLVEPGQRVRRGQLIARSGHTGRSTMPHLHFAVYRPVEWGRTQSLPIRFATAEGPIDNPRPGRRYRLAGDYHGPGAAD